MFWDAEPPRSPLRRLLGWVVLVVGMALLVVYGVLLVYVLLSALLWLLGWLPSLRDPFPP